MAMIDPSSYKYQLMVDIFSNKNIVEAINCKDSNYIKGQPDSLIYTAIFPYLRIPDTQNIAETYVLMAVDFTNINRNNITYCDVKVTLWVMSHQSLMKYNSENKPATRIDYISEELRKIFEGKRKFGFNKFQLISRREIILNEKYQYIELVFYTNDLRKAVDKSFSMKSMV